jgi:hypothetical protein
MSAKQDCGAGRISLRAILTITRPDTEPQHIALHGELQAIVKRASALDYDTSATLTFADVDAMLAAKRAGARAVTTDDNFHQRWTALAGWKRLLAEAV